MKPQARLAYFDLIAFVSVLLLFPLYIQAEGIAVEEIVERLLASEARMYAALEDISVETESIEHKLNGDGSVKEEKRFNKVVYLKANPDPDSARIMLVYERYLNFSKDGQGQNEKVLQGEINAKLDKLKKGRSQDRSRPLTDVFLEKYNEFYTIEYLGLLDSTISGYKCYHLKVRAKTGGNDLKKRIDADFYIDTISFRPVFVTFKPAKFKSNLMFKLKEMYMELLYANYGEDIWLPKRFYLKGKAKAGLFFTIRFSVTENYSPPSFNTGLPVELFEEKIGLRGPEEIDNEK
ncbi:hypothetical protein JYT16_01885 [Gemmatimonas aurantiaca]|nr:hypothetical protein [Gemmatimonas aurantiaca]